MDQTIVYEQPLNERMRTVLRLEFLFNRTRHFLERRSEWDDRATLDALLDIVTFVGRSDLKTELIKETDRLAGNLKLLSQRPGVDTRRLQQTLDQLEAITQQLHATQGRLGDSLKGDELVYAVMQRYTIAGGTCDFDLPMYRYWLTRPEEVRRQDLTAWFETLRAIEDAAVAILALVRDAGEFQSERAESGFFQKALDTTAPNQLIRVRLPAEIPAYPEISGGRHRFSIRFLQPGGGERPRQVEQEIPFELNCCAL